MNKALIVVGIVVAVGVVLLVLALFKFAGVVGEAHGRALYSSVGAWTRIQEFARAQGKTNYVAEADAKVMRIEHDLKEWRERAQAAGLDTARFEKMRALAYETTDQNIKNGQNPLAYLDAPPNGGAGSQGALTPASLPVETPLGIEIATLPHDSSSEDFKRFLEVFAASKIPCHMVADPSVYHAYVPSEQVQAARQALAQEQQKGLKLTIK